MNLIVICTLVLFATPKVVQDEIPFTKFRRSSNWIFIDRITIDRGIMHIRLETSIRGTPYSNPDSILFGVIRDDQWQQELNNKCHNFNRNTSYTHPINKQTLTESEYTIQLTEHHTYYFVVKDCDTKLIKDYSNHNLFLNIKLTVVGNNSHLSLDSDEWGVLLAVMGVGSYLLYQLRQSHKKQEQNNYAKILVFMSILLEVMAIFWKTLSFFIYWKWGYQYAVFDLFYLGLHASSETVLICLILLIAYGWSINYRNGEDIDLYIPLLSMLGFLSVIITCLNKINDQDHDKYHMYDSIPGYISIGFRSFMLLLFVIGIILTYVKTLPKKKRFILEFGVIGLVYIISMPVFVLSIKWLPQLHQKEFMFVGTEVFQLIYSALATYLVNHPKSSYNRYTKQNSSFLSDQKIF